MTEGWMKYAAIRSLSFFTSTTDGEFLKNLIADFGHNPKVKLFDFEAHSDYKRPTKPAHAGLHQERAADWEGR